MAWRKVGFLSKLMGKSEPQIDASSIASHTAPISLDLGGVQMAFEDGEWSAGTGNTPSEILMHG